MMKKRIYAVITALAMLCSTAVPGMGAEAAETPSDTVGTTYYVSTLHGKDSNDGKSEKTPFYSIQKINHLKLEPGDKVLLESGSVFTNGYLHLYEQSGSAEAPIVIDRYGTGAKPVIDTNGQGIWFQNYGKELNNSRHKYRGYVSSSILLYDTEYIEIRNLELVNKAPQIDTAYNALDTMNRTGVAAVAQNRGTIEHIHLDGLNIHDVQGNVYDKHMNNGGIYFTVFAPQDAAEMETNIPRYDDVVIENCSLEKVNRWGIAVGYTAYCNKFSGAQIDDETIRKYGATNVVIRNNYIKEAGGDAITTMYCYRPLIEYNVSDAVAAQINTTDYSQDSWGRVAAAIWPWKCKDAVFQYNEVFDTQNGANGNDDAQAWDADSGDGTLYQYNYSHNNTGGCVMFCLEQACNSTFRYNISQNDLKGALDITNNPDAHVYNNVFYMAQDVPFIRAEGRNSHGSAVIENNIIYYAGQTPREEIWNPAKGEGVQTYSNNLYYNYANRPEGDTAAVEAAAGTQIFRRAGSGPSSAMAAANLHNEPNVRSIFDGYKLAEGSPAIGKGKAVTDANGKAASAVDFFGNSLEGVTAFDIGAHQYQPDEGAGIPAAPQKPEGGEITATSVTLEWLPVQDLAGVAGYKVMNGDTVLADVKGGTSVTLENLNPGTQYNFSIVAYDAQGVQSAATEITVATAKGEEPGTAVEDPTAAKGSLGSQITAVKALNPADYTAESWSQLQTVLREAEAVMNDSTSTKAQLEAAFAKLSAAMNALQKAPGQVTNPVQPSLTLSPASATIYTKGAKTVTLKLTAAGIGGTANWSSSRPGVATVKNGRVTAKKAGKTVITATIGSCKATCTITVKKPTLKLTKKSITVKKGKKARIRVKAVPTGKITYKSSNKKVATVTGKGVVKGVKRGTSRITVKCNGVKKTVKVKVK